MKALKINILIKKVLFKLWLHGRAKTDYKTTKVEPKSIDFGFCVNFDIFLSMRPTS